MRHNVVESLFGLFASSDRAEALTGDLAEESAHRGWIWYWLHVVRITFVLWRRAATDAPLRNLSLMLAGLVLLSAPACGGVAAVFLFPHVIDSPIGWIVLPIFW